MEGNRAARRAAMRGTGKRRSAVIAEVREGILKPVVIPTSREPLKVYRIEHPDSGKGPFTHDSGRGRFASDAMRYITEPQDMASNLRIGSPHIFAFETPWVLMEAVQSLVMLREYGFHISVYDSNEHIVLPDGQVAFIKDKSVREATYPICDFPFEDHF